MRLETKSEHRGWQSEWRQSEWKPYVVRHNRLPLQDLLHVTDGIRGEPKEIVPCCLTESDHHRISLAKSDM